MSRRLVGQRWLMLGAVALGCATTVTANPLDPLRAPHRCSQCEAWNAPQPPFRVHGSTWYVGTRGLSVLMLETADGLALFDGALPQSAERVEQSLQALGHDIAEVRWIFASHAHFDHAGGIAALQQASGARVIAAPGAAAALRAGDVPGDDPQAAFGDSMRFPAVAEVTELADGESITIGGVEVTARHTPGHTPGGSSWSWRSCDDGRCVTAVYADSLNPVSADGFRFSDDPGRVEAFERAIAGIAALDCDLLVAAHPEFSGLFDRISRAEGGDRAAFVEAGACRRYADAAAARLRQRLQREAG